MGFSFVRKARSVDALKGAMRACLEKASAKGDAPADLAGAVDSAIDSFGDVDPEMALQVACSGHISGGRGSLRLEISTLSLDEYVDWPRPADSAGDTEESGDESSEAAGSSASGSTSADSASGGTSAA